MSAAAPQNSGKSGGGSDPDALRRWKNLLEDAFGPAQITVTDESHRHAGHLPAGSPSQGTHASVRVVSKHFEGLSLPERHRRVYAALGFGGTDRVLHALQVRALTPEEAARASEAKQ